MVNTAFSTLWGCQKTSDIIGNAEADLRFSECFIEKFLLGGKPNGFDCPQ